MESLQFAPDQSFAWVFVGLLTLLMVLSSWFDLRAMVIPKQLAIVTLVLGLLVNIVRGFWLGSVGLPAWQMGSNGPWVGAIDGLLFSIAGFAVGFSIFFVMWILGTAGGGDVKQFAAVCAWIGPLWTIYLLIGTVIAVALVSGVLLLYRALTRGFRSVTLQPKPLSQGTSPEGKLKLAKGRRVGWSVPATLATIVVLLWVLRVDLGLQEARTRLPGQESVKAGRQAS